MTIIRLCREQRDCRQIAEIYTKHYDVQLFKFKMHLKKDNKMNAFYKFNIFITSNLRLKIHTTCIILQSTVSSYLVFCFDIKPHTLNVAQCPKSRTRFESESPAHHMLPISSQQLFCYFPYYR